MALRPDGRRAMVRHGTHTVEARGRRRVPGCERARRGRPARGLQHCREAVLACGERSPRLHDPGARPGRRAVRDAAAGQRVVAPLEVLNTAAKLCSHAASDPPAYTTEVAARVAGPCETQPAGIVL